MRRPLLLGAAALAGAWTSPALAPIAPSIATALGIPRRVDDNDAVALTFDDGPHPGGTSAVLEVLEEASAAATFFLVGEQVERHRSLTREITSAGHAIALHGYRHRNLLRLTPGKFRDDLERGVAAIADATGVVPDYYRPPYGIFSPAGLGIVRRRGLRPLLWSRWGHDWSGRVSAEAIAAEVSADLRSGDVLLLHDADHYSDPGCWRNTAAALPAVLGTIERAGLRARAL
jgi:peptidoglycan/xylan/chitin deacetylase (PgdA/CDA1 family)